MGAEGVEPSQPKHLFYRQVQLSDVGALPKCDELEKRKAQESNPQDVAPALVFKTRWRPHAATFRVENLKFGWGKTKKARFRDSSEAGLERGRRSEFRTAVAKCPLGRKPN